MNLINEPPLAPPGFMGWSFTCELASREPRGGNIELEVYNGDIFAANHMHGFLPELPCASVAFQLDTAYWQVTYLNGVINQ